jgi:lipopolysaccharide assembly outer membrane protein LptD (OstA)
MNWLVMMPLLMMGAAPVQDTTQPYVLSADRMRVRAVDQDKITWLYGQVEIIHGSTILRGDTARISNKTQKASVWGRVTILDKTMQIKARKADYLKPISRANLYGRPRLNDAGWDLTADSMAYSRALSKSYAYGRVEMCDSSRQNWVFGDYGEYWHDRGYGFVTGRPRMEIRDKKNPAKASLINSDKMEVFQKEQLALASGNVSFAQDSLWASCGRMSYFKEQGRLILEEAPAIWRLDSRITGRTVEMNLKGDTLRHAVVRDSAVLRQFAPASADTDLISSDSLWAEFDGNKLTYAHTWGNVFARYHHQDRSKTTGKNLSQGREMQFYFSQGKPCRVLIEQGARGAYSTREEAP